MTIWPTGSGVHTVRRSAPISSSQIGSSQSPHAVIHGQPMGVFPKPGDDLRHHGPLRTLDEITWREAEALNPR